MQQMRFLLHAVKTASVPHGSEFPAVGSARYVLSARADKRSIYDVGSKPRRDKRTGSKTFSAPLITSVFPLHGTRPNLVGRASRSNLDRLKNYYGERIAFYFEFVSCEQAITSKLSACALLRRQSRFQNDCALTVPYRDGSQTTTQASQSRPI